MRISDWSSDVCSSDLFEGNAKAFQSSLANMPWLVLGALVLIYIVLGILYESFIHPLTILSTLPSAGRSEEHTSELQSLMRISYAVFCLKKKTHTYNKPEDQQSSYGY